LPPFAAIIIEPLFFIDTRVHDTPFSIFTRRCYCRRCMIRPLRHYASASIIDDIIAAIFRHILLFFVFRCASACQLRAIIFAITPPIFRR